MAKINPKRVGLVKDLCFDLGQSALGEAPAQRSETRHVFRALSMIWEGVRLILSGTSGSERDDFRRAYYCEYLCNRLHELIAEMHEVV